MADTDNKPLLRSDYRPLDFHITTTYLDISLDLPLTTVKSKLHFERTNKDATKFTLNGRALTLKSVKVNGEEFSDYTLTTKPGREGFQDLVFDVSKLANQDTFDVEIENTFDLENNLTLGGIYKAGEHICSQCEAESFRQITFYFDRPDNLSVFTVRVTGDKEKYPYLLSNGNPVERGDLDNGKHYVVWHDPFPKPCYLFACVAGKFDVVEETFTTKSGRNVDIRVFAEVGKGKLLHFAAQSIKRAMKWDEDRFGLEYDLDLFMVVAVSFFNMGAMENKGLNIFNDAVLIGDAQTANDDILKRIDGVIAHEYFHNWTGDRVTCRDWFQLTLKEGLTVFRDQEFTSDTVNRDIARLENVQVVKQVQFDEDKSPLAHPIRPDVVKAQDNFYTVTVYDKGAEVIRMIHTLIGEENFQKGMKLYFQRHDGKAVTCDDFVDAMQDASGYDLTKFRKWYSQSGTPKVQVSSQYFPESKEFQVTFKQINLPTADQKVKEPLVLPLKTEFLDPQGNKLTNLVDVNGNAVPELIVVDSAEKVVTLKDVAAQPVVVTNLDFSAPVELEQDFDLETLAFIAAHTTDNIARDFAVMEAYKQVYLSNYDAVKAGKDVVIPEVVTKLYGDLLNAALDNPGFYAHVLRFQSPNAVMVSYSKDLDPQVLVKINEQAVKQLYSQYSAKALEVYNKLPKFTQWEYTSEQSGVRALAAILLKLVTINGEHKELVEQLFANSICHQDRETAMQVNVYNKLGLDALEQQYQEMYREYPNILDGYCRYKTLCSDTLDEVKALTHHFNYDNTNPNRVRAVVGAATNNLKVMYDADGKAAEFITSEVLRTDAFNPHLGSTLVNVFTKFYKLAQPYYGNFVKQLEFLNTQELSDNVKEKVTLSLKLLNDK